MAFNVLILCTGNSARSILGEALINARGGGLKGFSAGSTPKAAPHPEALKLLRARGHDVSGLHSKSWDVFAGPDAPEMRAVITVCNNAAGEACPYWPGGPVQAHWGLPDPAAAPTDAQAEAFEAAYDALKTRIEAMAKLDLDALPPAELSRALQAIHDKV